MTGIVIILAVLALGLLGLGFAYLRLADRVEDALAEARDYAADVSRPGHKEAILASTLAKSTANLAEELREQMASLEADLKATAAKCGEDAGYALSRTIALDTDIHGGARVNEAGDGLVDVPGLAELIVAHSAECDRRVSAAETRVESLNTTVETERRELAERIGAGVRAADKDRKAAANRLDDLDQRVSALEKPKAHKARAKEAAE